MHLHAEKGVESSTTEATPKSSSIPEPVQQVWDNIFTPSELLKLTEACYDHGAEEITIFDRQKEPHGRTIIERALVSVLSSLGDDARYVEYWWRGYWRHMEAHRDVDEALCRRTGKQAEKVGVHRCPRRGHVLYLDIGPGICAPTCLWEESEPTLAAASSKAARNEDRLAGAPRELQTFHAVPAKPGRLLRFRGDLLHAVPKPSLNWLCSREEEPLGTRRSVLLFNLWDDPPTKPPSVDDPPHNTYEATAALARCDAPPACLPQNKWLVAASVSSINGKTDAPGREKARNTMAKLVAPLLGDVSRHGSEAGSLVSHAQEEEFRAAILSDDAVHSVSLFAQKKRTAPGGFGVVKKDMNKKRKNKKR